jgi:hypothetical protein
MTTWITRERPKIDRIAVPWLIKRFVDPKAQFLFVPANQVLEIAKKTGAIAFDIEGAEISHEGEFCSFDTVMKRYKLENPALKRLAVIVRGADTDKLNLAPECAGLLAVSLGLSQMFKDDHEQLHYGMLVYDALYSWATKASSEKHTWGSGGNNGQQQQQKNYL